MSYSLGSRSLKNLEGVHPQLVDVVKRAIKMTEQDFTVLDGVRTVEEQRENVRRGVSKTMNSYHLPQGDGFGHAVDLVPWVNGKPRWEWECIYPICMAVGEAAREAGLPIRWGGFWGMISPKPDRSVITVTAIEQSVHDYVRERTSRGRSAFIDGPHYEYRPDLLRLR